MGQNPPNPVPINAAAAQQQPVPAPPNNGLDAADRAILANIPVNGSVEKKVLLVQTNRLSSIGERRLRDSIKKLIVAPLVEEFKVDRPGKAKAVYLRRVQPQQPQQQPAVEIPGVIPQPLNPPCQTCQPPE